MSDPAGPRLLHIEPQLHVTDLAAAFAFFRETLGFEVAFQHGAPPFYGQVARDGVCINLRHVDEPIVSAEAMAREPDLICGSIPASDAKALFAEFERRGADFHQRLAHPEWAGEGTCDFIVRGPDGNLLHFIGPAA
jgi:catechol 2,3-dioxygenase-like lactoylglutathione lyase family enzyme